LKFKVLTKFTQAGLISPLISGTKEATWSKSKAPVALKKMDIVWEEANNIIEISKPLNIEIIQAVFR
jgi:hypothetical protein